MKQRLKNKTFWLAMIPAVFLLIQQVGDLFGLHLDLRELTRHICAIVVTVFSILALLGITAPDTPKESAESTKDTIDEEIRPA